MFPYFFKVVCDSLGLDDFASQAIEFCSWPSWPVSEVLGGIQVTEKPTHINP